MAKIFTQGDDSDLSLWLRPCLAADGATCNLSCRCRAREGQRESTARSRGCTMRKHKLFGAFGAFICPESKQHWRLWKRKLSPISITHQPICGWRVVAGSVPAGEAAVCPVAATQRDSLQRAEDTAVGGEYVDLGWVGFPPQGALQRCSFPKCCNFCLAP